MVQNGFHQGELGAAIFQVLAADHVANHKHIGLERQLFHAKAFDQFNAQGAQLVAHRGCSASIAASHGMARLACQRSDTAHERAANAQDMNMHGWAFYGGGWRWHGWGMRVCAKARLPL